MRTHAWASCLTIVLVRMASASWAQDVDPGVWTGYMQNPGGTPFRVEIDVPEGEDRSTAVLSVEHLEFDRFRVEGLQRVEGVAVVRVVAFLPNRLPPGTRRRRGLLGRVFRRRWPDGTRHAGLSWADDYAGAPLRREGSPEDGGGRLDGIPPRTRPDFRSTRP